MLRDSVDLLVVGGGVNGAGVARDACAVDPAADDEEVDIVRHQPSLSTG